MILNREKKTEETMQYKKLKVIISGGGTGGHIFPALSIAGKLKELNPDTEILFVGAEGRMEMSKVPAAGYRIIGLKTAGIQRKLSFKNILENLKLPFKLIGSIKKAGKIIDDFHPDAVVGVGGYASAPLLRAATKRKIPSLIQEQNSFAGVTNKLLGKKVGCICVAYEGMDRFFPADKICISGNPIRAEIHPYTEEDRKEGLAFYKLNEKKKHLLIIGGSLGSGTLNKSMKEWIAAGCPGGENVEVLWQCGKYYKAGVDEFMKGKDLPCIRYNDFISRMDLAYAMADLVISRSGASSISEICAVAKPAVFVPSPNVAEDHQTHNAMALVSKNAAVMVKDADAPKDLLPTALEFLNSPEKLYEMAQNAGKMAKPDAARIIADELYKLV